MPAHELTHLAFPTVPRQQLWIAEGLATYLEPIARARVGDLAAEKVWRDLVDGLPQGEPESGDRGLDRTRTWGRIYWGGALYCMLADLRDPASAPTTSARSTTRCAPSSPPAARSSARGRSSRRSPSAIAPSACRS